MLVSHMLYRTAQSSTAHRTESVSVMGHALTMEDSSTGSDQKQQNNALESCDQPEENHERLRKCLKVVVTVYRCVVIERHFTEHLRHRQQQAL